MLFRVQCTSNIAIGLLSLAMLYISTSWTSVFMSAWVMVRRVSRRRRCVGVLALTPCTPARKQALCWQQCGWLAHDFLHHQVFANRAINDAFGLFFGNFAQGFSVAWWKDKHNLHHAAPNEARASGLGAARAAPDKAGVTDSPARWLTQQLSHGHVAIDPDIDTLPMLAWSTDMLNVRRPCGSALGWSLTCSARPFLPFEQTLDASQRSLVRVQHWILFPILLFARLSWCVQSLLFPLRNVKDMGPAKAVAESVVLAVHYAWLLGASFTLLSPVKVRAVAGSAIAPASTDSLLNRSNRRSPSSPSPSSSAASCWGSCSSRATTAWRCTTTAATSCRLSWLPRAMCTATSSTTGAPLPPVLALCCGRVVTRVRGAAGSRAA